MEGKPLWHAVYAMVHAQGERRRPREQYSDRIILGYGLWAAIENKPLTWLSRTEHLPSPLVGCSQRPSPATLSRRLRSPRVLALLDRVQRMWLAAVTLARCRVKVIDAMPLPVGFGSHDRTAKYGYGGGGKRRGYKLLALIDAATGLIEDYLLMPMNQDEARAARQLVERMPPVSYLLGDANFDKNHLYQLAGQRGIQLVAPAKRSAKALGHGRHSVHRLRAKALLQGAIGRLLMRIRTRIERQFGTLVTLHFGLTPLPAWVRHLGRVGRWCQLKIVNHTRSRIEKQGLTAMMK